jgi:hypothetical protein
MAWGNPQYGGTAPSGSGYTKIYSTERAFAALEPPRLESPHAVIDPSALMTAKADAVELYQDLFN